MQVQNAIARRERPCEGDGLCFEGLARRAARLEDPAVPDLQTRERQARRARRLPRPGFGQAQAPVGFAVGTGLQHQARLVDDHLRQLEAALQQSRPGQGDQDPPRFEHVRRERARRVAEANLLRHQHRLRQQGDLEGTVQDDLAPGGFRQDLCQTGLVRFPVDRPGQDEEAGAYNGQRSGHPGEGPHKPYSRLQQAGEHRKHRRVSGIIPEATLAGPPGQ